MTNEDTNLKRIEGLDIRLSPTSVGNSSETTAVADITVTLINNSAIIISLTEVLIALKTGEEVTDFVQPGMETQIVPAAAQERIWNFKVSDTMPDRFKGSLLSGASGALGKGESFSFHLRNIPVNNKEGVTEIKVFLNGTAEPEVLRMRKEFTGAYLRFTIGSGVIKPGETTQLHWESNKIDNCRVTPLIPGLAQPMPPYGDVDINSEDDTTYTLTGIGQDIRLQAQVRVELAMPRILDFDFSGPDSVDVNGNVQLKWRCNKYTSAVELTCQNPDVKIPATLPVNATTPVQVGPITRRSEFKLTPVSNGGFRGKAEVRTAAINPPSILFFTIEAVEKSSGPLEVKLSWDTKNTKDNATLIITGDGGEKRELVGNKGTRSEFPVDDTTTYTLVVENLQIKQ